MNTLSIAKIAIGLVASTGVSTVVGNMIKVVTPVTVSNYNKVLTVIGGFVLTGMAGKAAYNYVADELDTMFPTLVEEEVSIIITKPEQVEVV